jgi:hypothetical protein
VVDVGPTSPVRALGAVATTAAVATTLEVLATPGRGIGRLPVDLLLRRPAPPGDAAVVDRVAEQVLDAPAGPGPAALGAQTASVQLPGDRGIAPTLVGQLTDQADDLDAIRILAKLLTEALEAVGDRSTGEVLRWPIRADITMPMRLSA